MNRRSFFALLLGSAAAKHVPATTTRNYVSHWFPPNPDRQHRLLVAMKLCRLGYVTDEDILKMVEHEVCEGMGYMRLTSEDYANPGDPVFWS